MHCWSSYGFWFPYSLIMISRDLRWIAGNVTVFYILCQFLVSGRFLKDTLPYLSRNPNQKKPEDYIKKRLITSNIEKRLIEKISSLSEKISVRKESPEIKIDLGGGHKEQREIPTRFNIASMDIIEGDIKLDPLTRLQLMVERGLHSRRRRAVNKNPDRRWINGTVPFEISKILPPRTRKEIRKAIRHWKRKTCLKFRPRIKNLDEDYIRFVSDKGCWSKVGRMGGEQKISIGNGCNQMGTIIHEIGHAVGFWHEQSRRDRDAYIRIMKDNILKEQEEQFRRMSANIMDSMGFAYDFWSIMHYGPHFFSKNGRPTIKIRKIGRRVGARIGQRRGLSKLDIAQIRAMYNCNKKLSSKGCFRSRTRNGRDYRGSLDYTASGVTCQHWNLQWPHRHNENLNNHFDGLGPHNQCRNPGGSKERPWCYTTLTRVSWEYCDIKIC